MELNPRYPDLCFAFGLPLAALILPRDTKAQLSSEAIWQQFIQWLPGAPPVGHPGVLLDQFLSHQLSAGISDVETDRQRVVRLVAEKRP